MKKFFTFFSLLLTFAAVKAQTTTWDFTASNPAWMSGSIGGTTPVVDYVDPKGLGLHGVSSSANFAAWNTTSAASWTAPNIPYTAGTVRVQTNGAGFTSAGVEATPTQRYFYIQVNQACTVNVWFKSGSTGASRNLIVSDGTTEYGKVATDVGATGVPTDGAFLSVPVTKAGTFYIYSDAAVNIYQIQVVGATVSTTPSDFLPVTFGGISATATNGVVKVGWSILTSTNTKEYVVERSSNGKDFSAIGTLNANGASNYSWIDAAPLAGTGFYKVEAVDLSGSIDYSTIVSANSAGSSVASITVAPNPVTNGQFTLGLNNLSAGTYNLSVYSNAGQEVYSTSVANTGGNFSKTIVLPAAASAKGIYSVRVSNGATSLTKNIVVE